MPANEEEMDAAIAEGIQVKWLSTIAGATKDSLKIEKMALDENGYPQPTGEYEELPTDAVVLAIGQNVEKDILAKLEGLNMERDNIVVDPETMMTSLNGIFAAGDVATTDRTVTHAIGMGKNAARGVNAFLKGQVYKKQPKNPDAKFEDIILGTTPMLLRLLEQSLRLPVVPAPSTKFSTVLPKRMLFSRHVVAYHAVTAWSAITATVYALIALLLNLVQVRGYEFNYDYCKGCGVCAQECPCGHIKMVPEQI